jgi:hypothetical protein
MIKNWDLFSESFKDNALTSKRIELVRMEDPYTNLRPGSTGTCVGVDDIGNILMKWDNGSTLSMVPEVDEFDVIDESNSFRHTEFDKTFELTTVDFTNGGDGVHALYINGQMFKYGDDYHDKIEIWIKAFIEGIKWSGVDVIEDTIECKDEEMCNSISGDGDFPPKNIVDVK